MEQTAAFQFSDEALKENKQRILLWQLFFPIILALFMFVSPMMGDNLSSKLIVFVIALIFIEGLLIFVPAIMFEKMKGLTLTLSSESIERTGRKLAEKIDYKDIRRIDINEKPSGKIAYIKVQSALKKTLYIGGFERMEMIAQHLEHTVSDKGVLHRKRQAVDWNSPLLQIATGTLTVIAILLIQGLGQNAYYIFIMFILFASALNSLIFKPITRSAGKRFEKLEIFASVFVLLCATAMAVVLLFFKP